MIKWLLSWIRYWFPGRAKRPALESAPVEAQATGGIQVYAFPADYGDACLISYGPAEKLHYIWVDGGLVRSYHQHLRVLLHRFPANGLELDLMVVTHPDQDHIGGILAFAEDEDIPKGFVRNWWFNAGRMIARWAGGEEDATRDLTVFSFEGTRSVRQGRRLEKVLEENGAWHTEPLMAGQGFNLGGAQLDILSPDAAHLRELHEKWQVERSAQSRNIEEVPEEDRMSVEEAAKLPYRQDDSVPNGASIAFLMRYGSRKVLMLGDAHPAVIEDSLKTRGYSPQNRLRIDLIKLSHHGSSGNLSQGLLDLIDCQQYLICTDGSRYGLPDKAALSRIVLHPKRFPSARITFFFNYDTPRLRSLFTTAEQQRHNFTCEFPDEGELSQRIDLGDAS